MLSYHVKRFVELGILQVASRERRHGRSVKLYSSTAKTFIVPFGVTPSETLEKLIVELTAPEARLFQRELARTLQRLAPDWGTAAITVGCFHCLRRSVSDQRLLFAVARPHETAEVHKTR